VRKSGLTRKLSLQVSRPFSWQNLQGIILCSGGAALIVQNLEFFLQPSTGFLLQLSHFLFLFIAYVLLVIGLARLFKVKKLFIELISR